MGKVLEVIENVMTAADHQSGYGQRFRHR